MGYKKGLETPDYECLKCHTKVPGKLFEKTRRKSWEALMTFSVSTAYYERIGWRVVCPKCKTQTNFS